MKLNLNLITAYMVQYDGSGPARATTVTGGIISWAGGRHFPELVVAAQALATAAQAVVTAAYSALAVAAHGRYLVLAAEWSQGIALLVATAF